MEKLDLSDLVIEVTRKCNMTCDHCLRGDMQNIDIPHEHITILLERVDSISTVTFTGGEPSLNVKAIQFFIDECKRLDICVSSFYIATNAKKVKDEFMNVLLNLYLLCDEKEMCCVDVSNSFFHQNNMYENDDSEIEYKNNQEKLQAFKFASLKHENQSYGEDGNYINEGRYSDFYGNGRKLNLYEIDVDDNRVESLVYLNCQGNIINGCDFSFESQNENDKIICTVDHLSIESIERYNELKVIGSLTV